MKTITLPGSSITTTVLGFGGSNLLGPRSRAEGRALLETAFDAGIRHFDVARSYSSGDAESVVGDFVLPLVLPVPSLKTRRDHVTLTTKFGIQPPKVTSGLRMLIRLSQFSNDWNFAGSYQTELRTSQNVHVVSHANVVNIVANQSASTVDSLALKSLDGRTCKATSRYYVICCGGIETARLLLASNNVEPKGLGNRNDLVGRYFQEHLHRTPIPVTPKNKRRFAAIFNAFRYQNFKHAPKIAASPSLQRKYQILNVGTEIIRIQR